MITELELILRLALAALFGGAIGIERELRHKTAGFRTNILICLGATVITIISISIAVNSSTTPADPGRIAAQIVTGVGFLGAGAIIQSRGSVVGLTTAASIWTTAGIGIALGAGYYLASIIATLLTVAVLHSRIPQKIPFLKKSITINYYIRYKKNPEIDSAIREFYEKSSRPEEEITFDIEGNEIIIRFSAHHLEQEHEEFQQRINDYESTIDFIFF